MLPVPLSCVLSNAEKRRSKPGRSPYTPKPRYDEVYEKGVEWLDGLAGKPLPDDGELTFDSHLSAEEQLSAARAARKTITEYRNDLASTINDLKVEQQTILRNNTKKN